MARLARSRFAIALSALLVTQSVPSLASADDAKTQLAAGDKASRDKEWQKALDAYQSANKAQPSAEALEGVANAHYQLKHDGDAYASYDEYVKQYGGKISGGKKAAAQARLKELGDKTGTLALDVSETGATITIDDKPLGTSPLAPTRVPVGPHRVRVAKEGFVPFDQVPNVVANATASLQVKLEAQSGKGRLLVKEKSGKAIRVFVDGVDKGDAPWSGEVDAGPHEVTGRSPTLSAPAEKVTVDRAKTKEVELVAQSSAAVLRVVTNDGKGLIYVDDQLVGEGSFTREVSAGPHKVRVVRDGYDTSEQDVVVNEREPKVVSVTLQLSSHVETGPVQKESRRVEGLYGGFSLLGTVQPGGMKSSMAKQCTAGDRPVELTGCDEGGGLGGGLSGFFGYHWDPVGVELFAAGQYDEATPRLDWSASSTDPGLGPDPARTEQFKVRRAGGLGALRVRLTFQGEKLRFSVAGGVGLSYRVLVMVRGVTATANAALSDGYSPAAQSYMSPVLSLEPSLQYRLGPATSVALGLSFLLESPSPFNQIPTTPSDGSRTLGPLGLSTPQYQLATGTQMFFGPFIGMMFGP